MKKTGSRRTVSLRLRAVSSAIVAAALTSACGIWPFNKIFNGIYESGDTVRNTSIGMSYVIPPGYYQNKYEAETIRSISLWKHKSDGDKGRIVIDIAMVTWFGPQGSTGPLEEDVKTLALSWSLSDDTEHTLTNIHQETWDGPHLPGALYSFEQPAHEHMEGCIVALVGHPGQRVRVESLQFGRPYYVPEVRDVALSLTPLPPSSDSIADPHK